MSGDDPTTWLVFADKALSVIRKAKELLPASKDREELQMALQTAEQELELARAMQARDLDYFLCDCDFPPGISLRQPDGSHRCNKCGRNTDEDYESQGDAYY